MEGFLYKQGEKGLVKSWKKRHFTLGTYANELRYFKEKGGEMTGSISLDDILDVPLDSDPKIAATRKLHGCGFTIEASGKSGSKRVYNLCALSKDERKKWIVGLRKRWYKYKGFEEESSEMPLDELPSAFTEEVENEQKPDTNVSENIVDSTPDSFTEAVKNPAIIPSIIEPESSSSTKNVAESNDNTEPQSESIPVSEEIQDDPEDEPVSIFNMRGRSIGKKNKTMEPPKDEDVSPRSDPSNFVIQDKHIKSIIGTMTTVTTDIINTKARRQLAVADLAMDDMMMDDEIGGPTVGAQEVDIKVEKEEKEEVENRKEEILNKEIIEQERREIDVVEKEAVRESGNILLPEEDLDQKVSNQLAESVADSTVLIGKEKEEERNKEEERKNMEEEERKKEEEEKKKEEDRKKEQEEERKRKEEERKRREEERKKEEERKRKEEERKKEEEERKKKEDEKKREEEERKKEEENKKKEEEEINEKMKKEREEEEIVINDSKQIIVPQTTPNSSATQPISLKRLDPLSLLESLSGGFVRKLNMNVDGVIYEEGFGVLRAIFDVFMQGAMKVENHGPEMAVWSFIAQTRLRTEYSDIFENISKALIKLPQSNHVLAAITLLLLSAWNNSTLVKWVGELREEKELIEKWFDGDSVFNNDVLLERFIKAIDPVDSIEYTLPPLLDLLTHIPSSLRFVPFVNDILYHIRHSVDAVSDCVYEASSSGIIWAGDERYNKSLGTRVRLGVCSSISQFLLHGFVVKTLFGLGKNHTLWNYIYKGANVDSVSSSSISELRLRKSIVWINDHIGFVSDSVRFRAFVCIGINSSLLHEWLWIILSNAKVNGDFYESWAMNRVAAIRKSFLSVLMPLSNKELGLNMVVDFEVKKV